jgi:hypothetical protein
VTHNLRMQVRSINDLYRTALMNRKYYARRLRMYRRWNSAMEITIAVGTSSVVAGWGIWRLASAGATAWGVLAALAALMAVLKPILQLPKELERYSKLHIGYCSLYYDQDHIIFGLQHSNAVTQQIWESFLQIRTRNNELGLEDETYPDMKNLRQCQNEVLAELPQGSLWLPTAAEAPAINTPTQR